MYCSAGIGFGVWSGIGASFQLWTASYVQRLDSVGEACPRWIKGAETRPVMSAVVARCRFGLGSGWPPEGKYLLLEHANGVKCSSRRFTQGVAFSALVLIHDHLPFPSLVLDMSSTRGASLVNGDFLWRQMSE